jgi:predicted unusual protein kinase regulating ubiquinone biosynthesis (AarF/ABC1/UbiB family)
LRALRSILPTVKLLLPIGRFERMLDQLEAMLARETDYSHERENIERMRVMFAERSDVPTPIPELTHAGVLSMSFEEGTKNTDFTAQRAQGIAV